MVECPHPTVFVLFEMGVFRLSWLPPVPLRWMVGISALVLFGCSSLRHALFQSGAYDLGFFDQAVYLISRGLPPIVSFWGFHVLGGHADWILYLIAPLYRLYPTVSWLFAIQALALASGAWPTWNLALQAGLSQSLAGAMALAYLLYPLVFNLNLFDFHPEVIALPLLLTAVLTARLRHLKGFVLCTGLILGCRAALSITVAALGLWLLLWEQRRLYGAIALVAGTAWFLIATQWVIPSFRPAGVESVWRYAFLGESLPEIIRNLILRPDLTLGRMFSLEGLFYLVLLLAPVAWGLSFRHLAPLVPAIPTLVINLLSESAAQRDLVHQYSLPALPFLLLAAIASLQAGHAWLRSRRAIVLWSLVAFLALAKYGYFGSIYLSRLDTWQATRKAMAEIQTEGSVLTTHAIAPHLTHRPLLQFTNPAVAPNLQNFDYVLLNLRHPVWPSHPEFARSLQLQLQTDPQFRLAFRQDEVYLFVKN